MSFALPPLLAIAFVAAFVPFGLLLLIARTAAPIPPGRRFVLATATAWGIWLLGAAWLASSGPLPWQDLLASVFVLFGTSIAGFILWSLLAWGFTASLLLSLARAGEPVTLERLVADYTGGGTLRSFLENRLGVLLRLNLVRRDGDLIVVLGPPARAFAGLASGLRRWFGVAP